MKDVAAATITVVGFAALVYAAFAPHVAGQIGLLSAALGAAG